MARQVKTDTQELIAMIRAASGDQLEQLVSRYGDDSRKSVRNALDRALHHQQLQDNETERINALYQRLDAAPTGACIVGIDEVGRGALAGPLLVAAVAIPAQPRIDGLNDSKQLTPSQREQTAQAVRNVAHEITFGRVEADGIDRHGMSWAMREAVRQALSQLEADPDLVLLDGLPLHAHPRETAIVKGDGTEAAIAAASIMAKVTRDAWMVEIASEYPVYELAANKGYSSAAHIAALRQYGPSAIHRKSFCQKILNPQLSLL